MDWLDFLAVQGTLKSLLQHHSSKASILQRSAFFIIQLSHPCITPGKTIALTRRTFVDKVMSLLFNMLSRLVITFLPMSKRLLISWLQSPSAVILEPKKIKSATVSTVSPSICHHTYIYFKTTIQYSFSFSISLSFCSTFWDYFLNLIFHLYYWVLFNIFSYFFLIYESCFSSWTLLFMKIIVFLFHGCHFLLISLWGNDGCLFFFPSTSLMSPSSCLFLFWSLFSHVNSFPPISGNLCLSAPD